MIFSLISSCSTFRSNRLNTEVTENIIDTILLNSSTEAVSYKQENITIYIPKQNIIKYLDSTIREYNKEFDSQRDSSYAERTIKRANIIKSKLTQNETYQILNPNNIDSLKNDSILDSYKIVNSNSELAFRMYLNHCICELLQNGNISILKNDTFIDVIYKKEISIKNDFSVDRFTIYSTEKDEVISRCPPFYHYDLVTD